MQPPQPLLELLPPARRLPPIVLALLVQLASVFLCGVVAWLAQTMGVDLSLGMALLLQAFGAVAFSVALRMPAWWLVLQALFVPALVLAINWEIAPVWYLLAFLLMLSIYWSTYATQVPLYLSRRQVWCKVAELLPKRPGLRVADLGSGLGGLVRFLAQQRQDGEFFGIEAAPLPVWFSKLRTLGQGNCHMLWGNFWQRNLEEYDVVFAYLSPVPMPELWQKAKREMRPGSLFISYRFVVPDVAPSEVIELQDLGQTKLYVWRM